MSLARRILAAAARPYLRLELPGWGRLLRGSGVLDDTHWVGAPTKRLRGKLHGYEMVLDLSNWSERQTYFLGRFYDLPLQLLIKTALRPGEMFIDVGGNVGMLTLAAASSLGPMGVIHTFEPNAVAFARLSEHVRINDLHGVRLYPCALGDVPGESTLTVVGDHTGLGTLAVIIAPGGARTTRYRVPVARGDDLLPPAAIPTMLKIDVEGFECRVLRGLSKFLSLAGPLVVTEAVECHLRRAGASKQELFEVMAAHGYHGFELRTRRRGLGHRFSLVPAGDHEAVGAKNLVWLIPKGVHEQRLLPYVDVEGGCTGGRRSSSYRRCVADALGSSPSGPTT